MKKIIYRLAKDFLGEPCCHPYHSADDCPYLQMEPDAIKKFALWADRKLKFTKLKDTK